MAPDVCQKPSPSTKGLTCRLLHLAIIMSSLSSSLRPPERPESGRAVAVTPRASRADAGQGLVLDMGRGCFRIVVGGGWVPCPPYRPCAIVALVVY